MAGFLINCKLNTARSTLDTVKGVTSAPAPYLNGQAGHIETTAASLYNFRTLPEAALESSFMFTAYPNLEGKFPDIKYADFIQAIFLKDGKTYWPGYNPNETMHVVYTLTSTPGPLYRLHVFIARETGGGPMY
jgi:hypothetical protein